MKILQEIEKHKNDIEWQESLKKYWKDNPNKLNKNNENQIVQLLNIFIHHSSDDTYLCMVFEVMGLPLNEIIAKNSQTTNKGIPIPLVRIIAKQILIGLDYLHRICGIIHTDINPDNIVVCLTKKELNEIYQTGSINLNKKTENKNVNKPITQQNKKIRKNKQKGKKPSNYHQTSDVEHVSYSSKSNKSNINYTFNELSSLLDNIDVNDYKLCDLIERPRSLSLPNQKIEDNPPTKQDSDDSLNHCYDFSSITNIEQYIKESQKIKNDLSYRKELLLKNKLFSLSSSPSHTKQINQIYNSFIQKKHSSSIIDENINVKIFDFGDACWINHHFSSKIQTRQYRSPEVILGLNYNQSADIWSFACLIFELVTGECLFDPIPNNENYSKDDDHLAQIIELLGKMPKRFALSGIKSKHYFTKEGKLHRINSLHYWPLQNVLVDKYKIKNEEAKALSEFLLPMLSYYPKNRASAQKMLEHPWLNMNENYNYYLNDSDYDRMMYLKENMEDVGDKENNNNIQDLTESEEEMNFADSEDNSEIEDLKNESDFFE